jgi:hypothetical protein
MHKRYLAIAATAIVWTITVWGEARAQSPEASPSPAPQAAREQPAPAAGPPVGVVIVEEDVVAPLIGEPEHHFHHALKYFREGKNKQSAQEIQIGAALLKLEAGRHEAANKEGLLKAADELDKLADQVKQGQVKSQKPLQRAFAKADIALATHYQKMAKDSINQADGKKTGGWLAASADYVERGAHWVGHKFEAGEAAVVRGARALGHKLEGGANASSGEVNKQADALGNEADKLGSSQTTAN